MTYRRPDPKEPTPISTVPLLCIRGDHHGKRETIDTGTDKRYVRRDEKGRFNESADVGKSLAADRRTKAKTVAKKGDGDRGDQKASKE